MLSEQQLECGLKQASDAFTLIGIKLREYDALVEKLSSSRAQRLIERLKHIEGHIIVQLSKMFYIADVLEADFEMSPFQKLPTFFEVFGYRGEEQKELLEPFDGDLNKLIRGNVEIIADERLQRCVAAIQKVLAIQAEPAEARRIFSESSTIGPSVTGGSLQSPSEVVSPASETKIQKPRIAFIEPDNTLHLYWTQQTTLLKLPDSTDELSSISQTAKEQPIVRTISPQEDVDSANSSNADSRNPSLPPSPGIFGTVALTASQQPSSSGIVSSGAASSCSNDDWPEGGSFGPSNFRTGRQPITPPPDRRGSVRMDKTLSRSAEAINSRHRLAAPNELSQQQLARVLQHVQSPGPVSPPSRPASTSVSYNLASSPASAAYAQLIGPPKHCIPHKFPEKTTKVLLGSWRGIRCGACDKKIVNTCFKCVHCQMLVHAHCMDSVPFNCCLSQEQVQTMVDILLDKNKPFLLPPSHATASSQPASPLPMNPVSFPAMMAQLAADPRTHHAAAGGTVSSGVDPSSEPGVAASQRFFPQLPNETSFSGKDGRATNGSPQLGLKSRAQSRSTPAASIHSDDVTASGESEKTLTSSLAVEETLQRSPTEDEDAAPELQEPDSLGEDTLMMRSMRWRGKTELASQQPRTRQSLYLKEVEINYDELQFGERIGSGTFADVYKGSWGHTEVAIKVLKFPDVSDARVDERVRMFKTEVRQLQGARHPQLNLFMGACMRPPKLAIVTALCKDLTLYRKLHELKERIPMSKATIIAGHIAQGMAYLHNRDIVHKDLRSNNIFISAHGQVKICDYALLNMDFFDALTLGRMSGSQMSRCASSRFAHALAIPTGFLHYLAPEIVCKLNKSASAAAKLTGATDLGVNRVLPEFTKQTDVYAFGEYPFRAAHPETLLWQVGRGMRPSLANMPNVAECKALLMSAWSYNPTGRPDFDSICRQLEHIPSKKMQRSPSHPVNHSRSIDRFR